MVGRLATNTLNATAKISIGIGISQQQGDNYQDKFMQKYFPIDACTPDSLAGKSVMSSS